MYDDVAVLWRLPLNYCSRRTTLRCQNVCGFCVWRKNALLVMCTQRRRHVRRNLHLSVSYSSAKKWPPSPKREKEKEREREREREREGEKFEIQSPGLNSLARNVPILKVRLAPQSLIVFPYIIFSSVLLIRFIRYKTLAEFSLRPCQFGCEVFVTRNMSISIVARVVITVFFTMA